MPDTSPGAEASRKSLSVCIIACKDLSLNMRTMRQARALARAGHSVTIVAYRSPDAKLAAQGTAVTLLATGAPLYPIWLMGRLWLKGRLLRDIAGQRRDAAAGVAAGRSRSGLFAQRAAHRLAERSFDVVQAHFDKALIAAAMLARPGRSKLVFDAVEVPFDGELVPKGPTARELRLAEIRQETEIARHADGWITVNDTLADAAVERFGIARPLVLRNLQDEGYRPPDGRMRRDLGLDANAIVLLHLNTMRSGEGLETAVDALAQLPTTHHLVVLGPVPRRSYLRAMRRRAAALGVAERFHLAPMQPPHAVPAYIAGANIGIIARESSLQNMRMSLPNRLFQMIAARLPVVVTPLPEIARIVRDWRVGLVFAESDAPGMAAAILKVGGVDAPFRAAVDHAAQSLTWERESARYVKFIEGLIRPSLAGGGLPQLGVERAAGE